VYAEVSRKLARLRRLLDNLNSRLTRASAASGSLTVLDTNVLLHNLPVDQIAW
jgi:hypothetical protein